MRKHDREFDSRDELEKAYFAGELIRGEYYLVKDKNTTYRLDVTRKGFVETNRND
ncbi:hypothetical protein D3C81_2256510 [compost metagenome]